MKHYNDKEYHILIWSLAVTQSPATQSNPRVHNEKRDFRATFNLLSLWGRLYCPFHQALHSFIQVIFNIGSINNIDIFVGNIKTTCNMIQNPQEPPWIVYSGTELKGKRSTRQIKFPGPISVLVLMILVTITWHYGLNITDVSIFVDIYRLNWQFNQHIYRYWDGSAVNTLGLVQEISLSANLLKVHIPIV